MKAITTVLHQERGLSLSEVMVNFGKYSNLLNEDLKCLLIEEFGRNIKFSESEKKNESQFVVPVAAKVEDFINSLLNINAAKSTAEVIKESLLEVDYSLDASFCDAQDFNQSSRQTKVPGVLMTFFSVLMN